MVACWLNVCLYIWDFYCMSPHLYMTSLPPDPCQIKVNKKTQPKHVHMTTSCIIMITVFIHFMNTGKESHSEVTIQQRTIQSVCKLFHPLSQCFLTNSLVTQKEFIKGTLKIISYILWRLNITTQWWNTSCQCKMIRPPGVSADSFLNAI